MVQITSQGKSIGISPRLDKLGLFYLLLIYLSLLTYSFYYDYLLTVAENVPFVFKITKLL